MKTIEVLNKPPAFNKCINGGFDFSQRGTTFVNVANGDYTLDKWLNVDNLSTGVFDVSQQADAPTDETSYSLRYDVTTSESIANNGYLYLSQKIEGNIIKSLYGKSIVVSFWVKSNKLGTYCVNLRNDALNRNYVVEYTINSASVWEQKFVVIPHDLTGTWATGNTTGVRLNFILASGSDYYTAPETWNTSNVIATSNQVNFADNTANFIQIAEVMIFEGRGLTDGFVLHGGNINSEELSCFRYYIDESGYRNIAHYLNANQLHCQVEYKVPMRATPSIILYYATSNNIVRSLNTGSTVAATVAALSNPNGFGRIDSAGLFVSGNLYHFAYIANSEL